MRVYSVLGTYKRIVIIALLLIAAIKVTELVGFITDNILTMPTSLTGLTIFMTIVFTSTIPIIRILNRIHRSLDNK